MTAKQYIKDLIVLSEIINNTINREIEETLRGRPDFESFLNSLQYQIGDKVELMRYHEKRESENADRVK